MTTSDDAVREHLAAFNAHDSGRLLRGFAPDAVWLTGTDTFTGQAGLGELFDEGLWELAPALELRRLVCGVSDAAAELRETLLIGEEVREYAIAVFFEFDDAGLISRAKVYREGSADL